MRALAIETLLVFAPSLPEAKRFYAEVLGLPLEREERELLVFRLANARLAIFPCERRASPEAYATVAGSALTLAVRSLDAALAELRSRGVRVLHEEPAHGPFGRYAVFSDPFGVVHELVEADDPPRGNDGGS